jgi:DNA-binding CsgD family transcriptional regulator
MERLASRDLRRLSEFLHGLYAPRDLDGFVAYTLAELPRLVSSDITVYGELNLRRHRFRFEAVPEEAASTNTVERFRAVARDHPFAQTPFAGSDGSAAKLSDLMTLREFRQRRIYSEFFRPLGVDREMAVWLPAPAGIEIDFAVHRVGTDFRERDRLYLNLLRPHLAQAYLNAEALTLVERAVSATGHARLLVGVDGRIGNGDARGRRLLSEYFGPLPRGDRLPQALARWIRRLDELGDRTDDAAPAVAPLTLERDGRRLTVRLFRGPAQRLLVLEEMGAPNPMILTRLGMSRREAEVLAWVAQGKTNDEIGTILGLSPRTIAKHLERMYPRLGVENRIGAAARALEALKAPAE